MVKGVQKRVVVVRCPDGKYFDQAIFMVRDQGLTESGQSPEQVLEEACRAADSYIQKNMESRKRYLHWVLGGMTLLGVLAIWLLR
jgi:hypothetical protein